MSSAALAAGSVADTRARPPPPRAAAAIAAAIAASPPHGAPTMESRTTLSIELRRFHSENRSHETSPRST